MKYTCSMETVQQNGRFTLFSNKFPSNIYSILFGFKPSRIYSWRRQYLITIKARFVIIQQTIPLSLNPFLLKRIQDTGYRIYLLSDQYIHISGRGGGGSLFILLYRFVLRKWKEEWGKFIWLSLKMTSIFSFLIYKNKNMKIAILQSNVRVW